MQTIGDSFFLYGELNTADSVFLSVFIGGKSGAFFEEATEMSLVFKAAFNGDGPDFLLVLCKQLLCFLKSEL